eukprot:759874-Rhodomonas_salina.1
MAPRRCPKLFFSALVLGVFLCVGQTTVEGLVAVSSEAASSQQCRGLQCMRLRGGFFGQKKKQEEVSAKPESFPVMNVVTASMATVLTM